MLNELVGFQFFQHSHFAVRFSSIDLNANSFGFVCSVAFYDVEELELLELQLLELLSHCCSYYHELLELADDSHFSKTTSLRTLSNGIFATCQRQIQMIIEV